MFTISIFNQKGGVGKTTTTANLAHALAARGARVLVLDLDPQANTTALLGVIDPRKTLFDALADPATTPLSQVFVPVGENSGITLAPGAKAVAGLEAVLRDEPGREYTLKEALAALEEPFDYVVADNGPTLGLPPVMSLVAADLALIPLVAERLPKEGLKDTFATISKIQKRMNTALMFRVMFSIVDERYSDGKEIMRDLRDELGERVLQTQIRTSGKLKLGAPVADFDPTGNMAEAYGALAEELVQIAHAGAHTGVVNGR